MGTQAENIGAYIVSLEHRYYGKSQPFSTLSAENLKYLTVENALADLASFQVYAQSEMKMNGPWIVTGGSYAGLLSAFYRLKYPFLVQGSLASSAPVRTQENFEEYDRHVSLVAGAECQGNIKKVVSIIEKSLKNPGDLKRIKKLFLAEDVVDPIDFLYLVADAASIAIQYGRQESFCNALAHSKNILKSYAAVAIQSFELFGITPLQDTFQFALDENPQTYEDSFGFRQWMYQSCTQLGYFQIAYHTSALSMRSKLIDLNYHHAQCKRLFGIQSPPETDAMMTKYLALLLNPKASSRIFFTNGTNDPWSNLSILPDVGEQINNNNAYSVMKDASHCNDLGDRSANFQVIEAKQRFKNLIAKWISE